jgi:hypothetical protein
MDIIVDSSATDLVATDAGKVGIRGTPFDRFIVTVVSNLDSVMITAPIHQYRYWLLPLLFASIHPP